MEDKIVRIDSGSAELGDWRSYRGIVEEGGRWTFLLWSLPGLLKSVRSQQIYPINECRVNFGELEYPSRWILDMNLGICRWMKTHWFSLRRRAYLE